MHTPERIATLRHLSVLLTFALLSLAAALLVPGNARADVIGTPTPSLQILEPVEGKNVVFQRLAPSSEGKPDQGRISIWLRVTNPTSEVLTVDRVEMLGQTMTDFDSLSDTLSAAEVSKLIDIQPGGSWDFQNCRCINEVACRRCIATRALIVDAPYPDTAEVAVYFEGAAALSETVNLEIHDNVEEPLAYFGRADDLTFDELWHGSSNHASDHQVFALDLGIRTWDATSQSWSAVYTGANKYEKESYAAYGKPIYAMAPGRVCAAINDHTEPELVGCGSCGTGSPDGSGGVKFNGGGNEIFIRTGDEISVYAHLQPNSIPAEYLVPGAPVKRGAYLGKVGFSGATSAPHIHVHIKNEDAKDLDCDAGPFRPMMFNGISSLTLAEADAHAENGTLTNDRWTNLPQHSFSHEQGMVYPSAEGFELCTTCTDSRSYFGAWRESVEIDIRAKVEGFKAFSAKWASHKNDRFHLIDVQRMVESGREYYVGIFRRGEVDQHLLQVPGSDLFASHIAAQASGGRQLVEVDTFTFDGDRHWIGIFDPSKEKHTTRDIVGYLEFGKERNQLANEGYLLIDVETYVEDGERHYFGVFRSDDEPLQQHLIQRSGFNAFVDEVGSKAGFHLADVESFVSGQERWYVGVLHPGKGTLAQISTYDAFQQLDEEMRNNGFRLVDVHVLE